MKHCILTMALLVASTSLFAAEPTTPNTLKVKTDTPTTGISLDTSDVNPTTVTTEKTNTEVSIDPENKAGITSADPNAQSKMMNANQKAPSATPKEENVTYKHTHPDDYSGEYDYDPKYED